ncbi:MAG: hypothetical protein HRU82_02515 [Nitrospira sp.]|nr:MAG: hypothetical protein HRU82_02515 [Nitrospira sp.]
MISGIDVNHFLGSLAVAMLGWIIKGVVSINSHLSQLNGSVGTLKEWAKNHEKQDDERYHNLMSSVHDRRD